MKKKTKIRCANEIIRMNPANLLFRLEFRSLRVMTRHCPVTIGYGSGLAEILKVKYLTVPGSRVVSDFFSLLSSKHKP